MALFSLSSLLGNGFWVIIAALIVRSVFFSEVNFSFPQIQKQMDPNSNLVNSTTKALSSSGFSSRPLKMALNLDQMHPPMLGIPSLTFLRRKLIDITYTLNEKQELKGAIFGDFGYASVAVSSHYNFENGKEDLSSNWELLSGLPISQIQEYLEVWSQSPSQKSQVSLQIGQNLGTITKSKLAKGEFSKSVILPNSLALTLSPSLKQSRLMQTAELADSDPKMFVFSQKLADLDSKTLSVSSTSFGVFPFSSKILWGIGLGSLEETGNFALSIGASNTGKFSNATSDFFKIGDEIHKLGAAEPSFDAFNLMNPWEISIKLDGSQEEVEVWSGDLVFVPFKKAQQVKSYFLVSYNLQVVFGEFKGILRSGPKEIQLEGVKGAMHLLQANW